MDKIYIHEDTGSAYRLKDGAVEFHPLSQGNHILSDDEWTGVEYAMVGDEEITHEGQRMTISDLEPIIRAKLA